MAYNSIAFCIETCDKDQIKSIRCPSQPNKSTKGKLHVEYVHVTIAHLEKDMITIKELEDKYIALKNDIQASILEEDIGRLRTAITSTLKHAMPSDLTHWEKVCAATTVESIFEFMAKVKLIGYLNVGLLKVFANTLIKDHDIQESIKSYESECQATFRNKTFLSLIEIFSNTPYMSLAPSDTMRMTFNLINNDWGKSDMTRLCEEVPKLEEMNLQAVSVTVTFSIPPNKKDIVSYFDEHKLTALAAKGVIVEKVHVLKV